MRQKTVASRRSMLRDRRVLIPSNTPLGRRCHLRPRRRPLEEPKKMRRRPATQQRALAACADSRQVPSLDTRRTMTDAVDAGVLGKQPALTQPPLYRCRRHAHAQELRPRDDSVLRARDPRELLLHRPGFSSHTDL